MAVTNFISTVWSENLYQALNKQYIAVANCNREFEGDIAQKGSVVKICGLENVNISNYLKNANMDYPETLAENVRELYIDQAKYFNFQIDDVDRAQASPRLMEVAMKNAANALANDADNYVYGLFAQAGTTIKKSDVNVDNIISYLIDARTALFANNVSDPQDIVFEVTPEVAGLILKAKVALSSDNTALMENGCIGAIGGCKIFVSNNIRRVIDDDGKFHKCIARTKRAIAFAEQLSEIDAYRPELRFADAVKGLHLYGAKVVYPSEMVLLDLSIGEA